MTKENMKAAEKGMQEFVDSGLPAMKAKIAKKMLDEFVTVGFNREEALKLVIAKMSSYHGKD
jgi:hypothetical protein